MKRLPAEWEPQDAVLLAWPHENTDWAPRLPQVQETFRHIAAAISRHERLIIAARDPDTVREQLEQHGVRMEQISICAAESNDTWARDFGPISIFEDGNPVLLDFTFNGWGGKFNASLDNQLTRHLHTAGLFGNTPLKTVDFILEGGSIESDGAGTVMTTSECLLNPNRNPAHRRDEIEDRLRSELGAHSILWLNHGSLVGDDTDAHIDTLARFAPNRTLLYVRCDDPNDAHAPALAAMEKELQAFSGFRLLPLPWPKAIHDEAGDRLPSTYANFLVINGAVLVPVYDDPPRDAAALLTLKQAFPGREIIGIDCCELIRQHGSLHCVTMQIPAGIHGRINPPPPPGSAPRFRTA